MDSTSSEEVAMTGKQTLKSDLAVEIAQEDAKTGDTGESHHNKETNSGWESYQNSVEYPGTEGGESHHNNKTNSGQDSSKNAVSHVSQWPGTKSGESHHDKETTSGWESSNSAGGNVLEWPVPGAGGSRHDKEKNSGWESWKNVGSHVSKWLGTEADNTNTSKRPSGWSRWEPMPGSEDKGKDGNVSDHSWGKGMRLGPDARQQCSRTCSPNSGWGRSHRSRSRSPSHGFKHETDGWNDRSRSRRGHLEDHVSQRSNRSSTHCYNFLKGTCDRGSACKFSHDGASADGYDEWPLKGGKREKVHDKGEFNNSFGCDWRSGAHRNSDIPCKYFAEGHCRNGENCKFSHQCLKVVGPEQGSQDGKCSHDLGSRNHSWDGTKWSERADAQNIGISPQWRNNNDSAEVGSPKVQAWDGPKWSDKAPDKCISSSPEWRSKDDAGFDIPGSKNRSTSSDGAGRPCHMDREESRRRPRDPRFQHPEVGKKHQISPAIIPEPILPIYTQNATPEVSVQQHVSTSAMKPVTSEKAQVQQHPGQSEQNQQLHLPPVLQSLNLGSYDQQMGHPTANVQSFNPNSQNQQGVLPVGNGQNFNPNGVSQQVILLPSLVQKYTPEDVNMSPVTSEMPISQSTANGEKVPCGTNFLASLVQKFGNGQELPLSHASLNHLNATGAVPSVPCSHPSSVRPLAPTAGQFVQSNQASWSQKQYDPISDSIEPVKLDSGDWLLGFSLNSHKENISVCDGMGPAKVDISDQPPGFSLNSHEQNTAFEGSLTSMKHLAVNGDLNNGDHRSHGGDDHDNQEFMNKDIMAKKVDEKTMSQNEKEMQTSHRENMDVDGQADEESKRRKDEKGMRMFKFALVEFVKELLKPSWKEGHFSRDDHKTIVKKAVDKVIGSIQGCNIPQTQEKVDHYLSYSKPKLMKLVQAYVDKYSKT